VKTRSLAIFTVVLSVAIGSYARAGEDSNCAALFSKEIATPRDRTVKVENNQIVVDGEAQPQLYGAEFQYFRLRGGYGKNVPREKVIEIWQRGLDQMVKAGMNSISFYIPWDFHEYAPGKFDFTGSVDEDGDGRPDYPSRDLLTFLKMVEEHGIKRIMVRPGPYVNAEWGFLGFGAVPEWFHDKYPESHMRNAQGLSTRLYDYHNEDFLRHTKLWFEALNDQVLSHVLGKDKPVLFMQLDNETNFQWQSIYNHDYGQGAVARYSQFLKSRYGTLTRVNLAQSTDFKTWADVRPPTSPDVNLAQDQDWYRFQDWSIYTYLGKVRKIWEDLGVREPNVLFTLAESFNAPKNGLLPNYRLKNQKGKTGLMTINVYPKTYPSAPDVLFHQPHKSDYDILAASASNKHYLGSEQEAVIGPEIHTGWFGKTILTEDARRQTYLTLLGRGMKAPFFYYFNEGFNWQVDWGKKHIEPFFNALKEDPRYKMVAETSLPDAFWNELQTKVDHDFMAGWNVKYIMTEDTAAAEKLSFAAPLDGDARPTEHFSLIAEIGQKIIKPYGKFLAEAVSLKDPVAIIADDGSLTPSPIPGIDSRELHSDLAGGLVGYVLQAGFNPTVHHWGINSTGDLAKSKIIFIQDSGNMNPHMIRWLADYVARGGTVVNFVGDSIAKQIGAPSTTHVRTEGGAIKATYVSPERNSNPVQFDVLGNSVAEYEIGADSMAKPVLFNNGNVIGYSYAFERGRLIQLGAIVHDAFNTGAYGFLNDVPQRRKIIDDIAATQGIESQVRIHEGGDRVVAFARKAPNDNRLWITVKSGRLEPVRVHIQINRRLLMDSSAQTLFTIKDVMSGRKLTIDGESLARDGFPIDLTANGSTALLVSKNAKINARPSVRVP
jgi:hypothetical protein